MKIKSKHVGLIICALTIGLAGQVTANDKGKGRGGQDQDEQQSESTKPEGKTSEPWVRARVAFTDNEREIVRTYVKSCTVSEKPGKRPKGLPPGLAKKVARGRNLPPGWQNKCVPGKIMPQEVYKRCEPLPKEVVVKLPSPPEGTIIVAIDGKVARLAKATLEILDVFDVR